MAAELAFRSDFAGDAGDFGGESIQLIDHGVDGVFELEDFALDVDGDFFRQVAVGNRNRHVGDVTDLSGQVAGHGVHAIGQIFPSAGDAGDDGLAAELAVGADFTGDAGDFGGESIQLIDHRVDGVFELEDFAFDVDGDFFRQVAVGHGDGDVGDVSDLRGKIAGHHVDALGQVFPDAADVAHLGLAAELAFGADLASDAGDFGGESVQLIDHGVHGFFQLEDLATHVDGDFFRQVAVGDGNRHVGDVSTCAVRLPAIMLTLSVKSFQTPLTSRTWA